MLGYIRRHDCKSFDELVGCVLNDLRVDGDSALYGICFDCSALCVDYCDLCLRGRIDCWMELMEQGWVT
ncbi:MAG: hypothetical protein HDQ88_04430 [Clostridia bacterium]|nr:hypothetical protein [Clostridia bacterium]